MEKIDREKFPQLNLILWDTKVRFVEPLDALNMYERRWRYVDRSKLTEKENQLILGLAAYYRDGLFLPAD